MSNVRIQDFRGLADLAISLEPLTVLVGENNSGKSSILQALAVFFGTHRATEDDLHVNGVGDRASRFVVDVRFVPMSGTEFNEDVQARLLGKVQIPTNSSGQQFFTIRAIGQPSPDGSGIALDRRFLRGWADTRAEAAALQVLPDRPGREHLELVAFFLLDARRDLVDELRNRTSHWGRLLSDLDVAPDATKEIEKALAEVGQKVVESSPVLAAVKSGLKGVKEALGGSVSDVAIAPIPGRVDDLARAVDVTVTRPSGAALPLRLQGSGSRSLAAVMVFESFIKQRIDAAQGIKPLVVGAFEEPEAHLHPQAHRAMLKLISSLGGQKLVSTHSPHVARVADVYSIRSITRKADGSAQCRAVPRIQGTAPTFSDGELVNIQRFVQRNNGEILFARVVIVFEGDTEDFALPVFALRHWGKDHSYVGVSFAHTDGAGNGKHVVRILEYLGIPWVLLADGDDAGDKGIKAIEATLNRKLTPTELVQFGGKANFEKYLLDAGYRPIIESAIGARFGAGELANCKKLWAKQKGPGGQPRDYVSAGWEDRLVYDFCVANKGTIGEVIAEAIVADSDKHKLAPIPKKIQEAFGCADKFLAV